MSASPTTRNNAAPSVAARDALVAGPAIRSPTRYFIGISPGLRLDIQLCILLLLLTAVMVLPGVLTLPMELWDESRNANNAMEITRHGNWMVPTFGYVPDHWNTKPPLLIWLMASLLRTGLDPLIAVRLPSVAATMGSVLLVYLTCRISIQDRLAGVLSGLMIFSSVLFLGDHVGRTGDYDALLSLLGLGFVLCVGCYIDAPADRSGAWIGGGAVLLFLAFMTKGVAAGLSIPGLIAYAVARGRLVAILRDWRLFVSVLGVIAGVAGWLLIRERLDPGYFAAVWNNDVSGRLLSISDGHAEGPLFYLKVLAVGFEPAILLSPTLLLTRRDPDPDRRRLCLLMTLTALSSLIALSCARTKIYWYVAPLVPLLAIAIGTATTSFLRRPGLEVSPWVVLRPIAVAMLLAFWCLNIHAPDGNSAFASDRVQYGAFLKELRGQYQIDGATIIDDGMPNESGLRHYNPIARFFVEDAGRRGDHIHMISSDEAPPKDVPIISCDPQIRDWLKSRSSFSLTYANSHCVIGRLLTSAAEPVTADR
jgi:4-amino-4-deoxy-L-arabinose transferase-like glycosyltransferase